MVKADLHIHSKYSSDGEHELCTLVDMCASKKVDVFSITDHNTVSGIAEAAAISQEKGIGFIPGIEIDCRYKGVDLHLLGYNISLKNSDFTLFENVMEEKARACFSEMIYKLARLGVEVDKEVVLKRANGKIPIPELIAEVLLTDETYFNPLLLPYMKGGSRSDMPYLNFYFDFFAQGKPAYVEMELLDYDDAAELIIANGGSPVIAHPGHNFKGKEWMVEELISRGAKGIEVFNNYHSSEQVVFFAELAEKNKALMTCGSDFHGKTKPIIEVGCYRLNSKYADYLAQSTLLLFKGNKNAGD